MARKSRAVNAGGVIIGGSAPITVQSMLNAPAHDVKRNLDQLKELELAGCEIVRMSVPDEDAAKVFGEVCKNAHVPIVADIHFDYRLALAALKAGASKIRINPGNIGSEDRVKTVADACKAQGVPIRVGVNSGSVEKELIAEYGGVCPEALAESAMNHVHMLEECGFYDTVISIKSSDVRCMINAYRAVAGVCDYPLHLGVTEAGTYHSSIIKSAVGIGSLLADGIGDTIRVSITDTPVREVAAGFDILKALELRVNSPVIISCPTCGRTQIDLVSLANRVEEAVKDIHKPIKIAVMGCVVNGPGEAATADIGVAGGKGCGMLFKGDKILRKVSEEDIVDELLKEIELL